MAFIPDKLNHGIFAFRNLNSKQYKIYAQQYFKSKTGWIPFVYDWVISAGVLGIVADISKGITIDYNKRKLAAVCIY